MVADVQKVYVIIRDKLFRVSLIQQTVICLRRAIIFWLVLFNYPIKQCYDLIILSMFGIIIFLYSLELLRSLLQIAIHMSGAEKLPNP